MAAGAVVGGPKDGLRTKAFGTLGPKEKLQIIEINRRHPLRPHDVLIEIAYCGICHSDIHIARNDWGHTIYPIVPGHEIVGFVRELGSEAKKFKVGDKCGANVAYSCGTCGHCTNRRNNYCKDIVFVANSRDEINEGGGITYGGYSTHIVINENYVLKWPDKLPMDKGAPLLCAGLTVYPPLRYFNAGPGTRVGVVGLGGLGHMAVRLAHELGAFVCVFSRRGSEKKKRLAAELGADLFVETAADDKLDCGEPLDVILDTVSAHHDITPLVELLKFQGTYVVLGYPAEPLPISAFPLATQRRTITGTLVGSTEECQEMLDFCAERGITCMTETIPVDQINSAFERTVKGDVYFRFVIDIKGSSWDK